MNEKIAFCEISIFIFKEIRRQALVLAGPRRLNVKTLPSVIPALPCEIGEQVSVRI